MRVLPILVILGVTFTVYPAGADPITYASVRSVGEGIVDLSITTDGTRGVLTTSNLVDWLVTVTWMGTSFTIRGPQAGNNSQAWIAGTALSATAQRLTFNFSAPGVNFALFQSPGTGSGGTFYCAQTAQCSGAGLPGESLTPFPPPDSGFTPTTDSFLAGRVVLATATPTPVPEPTSIALLAAGMLGLAARRLFVST